MILLIDNYDSFVHNLARYFRRLGQRTHVVRNDCINLDEIASLSPNAIVLSPGPRGPLEAGICLEVVQRYSGQIPLLGVCLGHQVVAQAFGARIVRSAVPMHGRSSPIEHDGKGLFESVPDPTIVGRYHSLTVEVETLPTDLVTTAQTADGTIMGLRHARMPVYGVQFHPESILTTHGYQILENFLRLAGVSDRHIARDVDEQAFRAIQADTWPERPVTF